MNVSWFVYPVLVFPLAACGGGGGEAVPASINTIRTNETLTITGINFGAHALDIEWTGDHIESGATGATFAKTGWTSKDFPAPGGGFYRFTYETDSAHSGTKSLRSQLMNSGIKSTVATYNVTKPVNPGDWIYVTWWSRYMGETTGQWKQLRLSREDTVVDGTGQIAFLNWFETNDHFQINPSQPDSESLWPSGYYVKEGGTWYRQEIIVKASTIGVANGSVALNRYGNGSYKEWRNASLQTLKNAGANFNYVIFQNYLGNGIGSGQVWLDDIYIAHTQARVEICDSSTWAARTHCEVQVPTTWSETAITISGNTGSFSNGTTAYIYVLDANGNVVTGEGRPVIIENT